RKEERRQSTFSRSVLSTPRTHRPDSSTSTVHPAPRTRSPGGASLLHASLRGGSASCRSSRCHRSPDTSAGAPTGRRFSRTRRIRLSSRASPSSPRRCAHRLRTASSFELLSVPVAERGAGLVRRLQKLHQRLAGRRRLPHVVVLQKELAAGASIAVERLRRT